MEINKFNSIHLEKINKIFEDCCVTFSNQFANIRNIISQNLLKLRLSIVEQTVDNVIANFFNEGMMKFKEDFESRLKEVGYKTAKEDSKKVAGAKT